MVVDVHRILSVVLSLTNSRGMIIVIPIINHSDGNPLTPHVVGRDRMPQILGKILGR